MPGGYCETRKGCIMNVCINIFLSVFLQGNRQGVSCENGGEFGEGIRNRNDLRVIVDGYGANVDTNMHGCNCNKQKLQIETIFWDVL